MLPLAQRITLQLHHQARDSALARSSLVEAASPADIACLLVVLRSSPGSADHNSARIGRIRAGAVPTVLAAAIDLGCKDRHHSAALEVVT